MMLLLMRIVSVDMRRIIEVGSGRVEILVEGRWRRRGNWIRI
jgi:hypothetical protein